MRQRFEQQYELGITPISEVVFPLNSRHQLPAVLKALQYIFITPELSEQVFALLEEKVCSGKKKTGRTGMDLWHILVLGVVRHAHNDDWDRLHHDSNNDMMLRQVLGVQAEHKSIKSIEFKRQTIIDNASLVDDELLGKINVLIAAHGQKLFKKKEDEPVELKTDSFVVETDVHFPTDLNLLWDSNRKCLDMVADLVKIAPVKGWREIKSIRIKTKRLFRSTSQIVFKGKNPVTKKEKVREYINSSLKLKTNCEVIIKTPPYVAGKEMKIKAIIEALKKYCAYVDKFCDQIERRLIKGEVIPAEEKVYSIFEDHTEWLTKGKLNKKVELGVLATITTDQNHIIIDYKVTQKQRDHAQVTGIINRVKTNYPELVIGSHSFDKGYYSKQNRETVEAETANAIMPKKGKHSLADKERESDKTFRKLRNKHSAIESNINMLEHHGLNRCLDRGIDGLKRYVGLSVLAYNLHIIGNHLLKEEKKKQERLSKQRERYHRQAA